MQSKVGRSAAGIAGMVALMAATSAAAANLTVYESRMPDGTTVLGDRPTGGARAVVSHRYEYTPSSKEALEAERNYWRSQSEAFQRRQAATARIERTASAPATTAFDADGPYYPMWAGHGYGASRPLVPFSQVPRTYTSSPGAVNGRQGGFIGSGFSTAR